MRVNRLSPLVLSCCHPSFLISFPPILSPLLLLPLYPPSSSYVTQELRTFSCPLLTHSSPFSLRLPLTHSSSLFPSLPPSSQLSVLPTLPPIHRHRPTPAVQQAWACPPDSK